MQDDLLDIAARLTDDELLRRMLHLAGSERKATVELVAHLAVLDARKLHLSQGHGSLFSYCTATLHLEHAAYNRIEAARASRRFPGILDRLARGSLNLSTVRLIAPHLTPANHQRLLDEAAGKSKREVEALVARLAPRPDVPASVRKLPPSTLALPATGSPAALGPPTPASAGAPFSPLDHERGAVSAEPRVEAPHLPAPPALDRMPGSGTWAAPSVHPAERVVVAPLAPERYRVQFTVGSETYQDLRRVQDLLRREIPDGDPGTIFGRALKLLLADVARRKLAATPNTRPARPTADRSRHIPARVKRAVWLRDGAQCAFVAQSGRRCREHAILEFHHVIPHAVGGETTPDNLSLRCR